MANLVITSTETKVHIHTGNLSSYFNDTLQTSIMKSNMVKLELVENSDIGDYVFLVLSAGQNIQLTFGIVDSINGITDIPNIETMYDLLNDLI